MKSMLIPKQNFLIKFKILNNMEKLNLDNYGVVEMNNTDMKEEQGGIFLCLLAGLALGALIVAVKEMVKHE